MLNLTTGEGIALAAVVLPAGLAAVKMLIPANGNNKFCAVHEQLAGDVTEMKKDVKTIDRRTASICGHLGISVEKE
jgi:hypothetical protein